MPRSWRVAAALVGLQLLTACLTGAPTRVSGPGPGAPPDTVSGHDWTRFGWDVGRSSASTATTGINASNVASMTRQQVQLSGTVDASAIYLSNVQVNSATHNVFFVTTTYGKTIAVDADSGTILWTYVPPNYSSWSGSAQITNSTPVSDPDRQFLYAASPDGNIQKLAVADGHAVWSTAITTLPQSEKIASPLNYFAGRVIATTGGYIGDAPPYQGHVAILNAETGELLHVWNSLCSDQAGLLSPSQCPESGSAIWGRAGAVIDSTTGDIYVATGNGFWDGITNWGDAVLVLDSSATHLVGNYTPANTATLDTDDQDLGSTSPVLLATGYVVQGGKDGQIRLLSTAGMSGSTAHVSGEAQVVSTPSGTDLFTAPAVLKGADGSTSLFAADNGATTAWTLSGGKLSQAWHNSTGGTSPVLAGGLLFVYNQGGGGLVVYQPGSGSVVATLPAGSGHWSSPIIADGRIALPEGNANSHGTSGILDIWRLP